MKTKALFAAIAITGLFVTGGCTKEAQEDFDQAGEKVAAGTEKSAEATGRVVEGAVEGAAKGAKDAGQTVAWTMKVKNALFADPQIAARKLNVDSKGDANKVTITGTVQSQAEKDRVTKIAQGVVGGKATINNQVKVARAQ